MFVVWVFGLFNFPKWIFIDDATSRNSLNIHKTNMWTIKTSITSLTLDNNNFSKLPLNLTSAKLLFFSLMGNENMVELSPGAISLENMDKKTVLHFPCSMQYIPMDLLIGSKSAVQGFLKSTKFCTWVIMTSLWHYYDVIYDVILTRELLQDYKQINFNWDHIFHNNLDHNVVDDDCDVIIILGH